MLYRFDDDTVAARGFQQELGPSRGPERGNCHTVVRPQAAGHSARWVRVICQHVCCASREHPTTVTFRDVMPCSSPTSSRKTLLPSSKLQSKPRNNRAIAKAVSRRLLTTAARVRAQVMWNFWWTKWYWVRFSPRTSVSPVNSHSTDCSTLVIIYHPGLVQWVSLTPPQEIKRTIKPASSRRF
jgi:hypothetical protein